MTWGVKTTLLVPFPAKALIHFPLAQDPIQTPHVTLLLQNQCVGLLKWEKEEMKDGILPVMERSCRVSQRIYWSYGHAPAVGSWNIICIESRIYRIFWSHIYLFLEHDGELMRTEVSWGFYKWNVSLVLIGVVRPVELRQIWLVEACNIAVVRHPLSSPLTSSQLGIVLFSSLIILESTTCYRDVRICYQIIALTDIEISQNGLKSN